MLVSHPPFRSWRACSVALHIITATAFVSSIGFPHVLNAAPPVPHITVVADNPVEGLRALANQHDASYQVFLWRADAYLHDQFRNATIDQIATTLTKLGATKIAEWGTDPKSEEHVERFSVLKNVIKSKVGHSRTCIVELDQWRDSKEPSITVSILADFGQLFKIVAAHRDYPDGTVLDRIFGLRELELCAKDTPQLDSIEVSFGPIGFISDPKTGDGFTLDVKMTNPFPRGRLKAQSAAYMVYSGLEPVGWFPNYKENIVHVARDTLLPADGSGFDCQERGHPPTFISLGIEKESLHQPRQ